MNKNHADYGEAVRDLKQIFGQIIQKEFHKPKSLKKALENWINIWSTASVAEKLNEIQKVEYLGVSHLMISH